MSEVSFPYLSLFIVCLYDLKIAVKFGECPDTTAMIGLCVVKCESDEMCPGNKKCVSSMSILYLVIQNICFSFISLVF